MILGWTRRSTPEARRVIWGFRALLYGAAALGAALLLSGGGDGARLPRRPDRQGNSFRMELEDGRPTNLGTYFGAKCERGADWRARWWSFDGKTARFRFDDGELRVSEKLTRDYRNGWIGDRTFTLEARVDDERVSGTMRYVETQRYTDGTSYVCESGDVSFSAG